MKVPLLSMSDLQIQVDTLQSDPSLKAPPACMVQAQQKLCDVYKAMTIAGEIDDEALDFINTSNNTCPDSQDIMYICSNTAI